MVETIEWRDNTVVMIDQTVLPREEKYVICRSYTDVADAIKTMVIRGAPAIGVAAAMGVAVGVLHASAEGLDAQVDDDLRHAGGDAPHRGEPVLGDRPDEAAVRERARASIDEIRAALIRRRSR